MRLRVPALLTVIFFFGILAPTAGAFTPRFAAPAAVGTGDCTNAANACTLGTAYTDAVDGDELILLPGTFELGNAEFPITKALNVHGQAGSPMPVLHSTAFHAAGVSLNNEGAALSYVDLEYGGATLNGSQGGLLVTDGTASRVISHTLSNGAIACALSGDVTAPDSLIRDSVCWGQGSGGIGVGLNCACPSFNAKLRNVDAIGTQYGMLFVNGLDGQTFTVDAKNVIPESVFADVSAYATTGSQRTVTINLDHSAYDNYDPNQTGSDNAVSITPPGTGTNLFFPSAADIFVSTLGDFHQKATSPTINAGETDAFTGTTDLDGVPRPQGTAIDIGAYEVPVAPGGGPGPTPVPGPGPGATIPKKKCKKKGKKRASSAKKKKCKKKKRK
jgi:hypothetical protein